MQDLFPRVEFTNTTPGNNFYSWNFGDSTGSTDYSPYHEYTRVGTFNVLLVVTNLHGCIDSVWSRVEVEQGTAIYLPNSFTPNDDGSNDIYRPVYYNQRTIKADIFNRWGELVFESQDLLKGWDGYYRGQLSQQDVYVYQCWIRFVDNHETERMGDLTLFR